MNPDKERNKELYYRLIALWVVCEAFAGGIMHAVKIPFTGMIVSSLSVMCIILIAFYVHGINAIIKATLIVAVFKLMLSPHSPPTAYIAVFFQGYLGHLLFYNKKFFTASAIILSVLALVESAMQRILVLIILYGNTFWHAVNQYVQKLVGGYDTNYSFIIASVYILIHAIAGLFIGIFAVRLANRSSKWKIKYPGLVIDKNCNSELNPAFRKNKKVKWLFIIIWIALVFIFIHSYVNPSASVLPAGNVFKIIIRALLIILSWYLFFAPLIMQWIRRMLSSHESRHNLPTNEIMLLIPETKYLFIQSWSLAGSERGFKRFKVFLKILLVNILLAEPGEEQKNQAFINH